MGHKQNCVLNVGQFSVQIMRLSGSVFDANQQFWLYVISDYGHNLKKIPMMFLTLCFFYADLANGDHHLGREQGK